jgi:hypothetical protein
MTQSVFLGGMHLSIKSSLRIGLDVQSIVYIGPVYSRRLSPIARKEITEQRNISFTVEMGSLAACW